MKYIITVLLFIFLFYELSYAKYNWSKKNRLAAIGAIIIGIAAFALPIYLLFFTDYEL